MVSESQMSIDDGRLPRGAALVIIPAFNEEASIGHTLASCAGIVEAADIVVIDDGSDDATARVVQEHGVACVRLAINLGIGGAMQTGYRYALERNYPVALQVDADGQHSPRDIKRLIEPLRANTHDMVIGGRYTDAPGFKSTPLRRFGSWILHSFIRLTTGKRIRDCTSGFRAVNRRIIAMFAAYYPADYPEPESLAIVLHNGLRVTEVPVTMAARHGGVSSIRPFDSLVYMVKLVSLICVYGVFKRVVAPRERLP